LLARMMLSSTRSVQPGSRNVCRHSTRGGLS
jgi:hypothetical protein